MDCGSYLSQPTPRRAVNGLNVEIATPQARCMSKPPISITGVVADGVRWLGSGGSELSFGLCDKSCCPMLHDLVPDKESQQWKHRE